MTEHTLSVVMMGATGAVGSEVVRALTSLPRLGALTLLGRRIRPELTDPRVRQHVVDVFDPSSYEALLPGHGQAVCTLGVGQPSKVGREEFLRVDRDTVVDFATRCRAVGVGHFELLGSVGADPSSRSFYLRSKGELEAALEALDFPRLSLFRPSMILTETNRYGLTQALTLAVWPRLGPILSGPLRKLRGVRVEDLGRAMAHNLITPGGGVEVLRWDDFGPLARSR